MKQYNVTAEVHADAEHLVDELAKYHAAAGPLAGGWTQITITLPADDLEQACITAMALLHRAGAGGEIRQVEVLTTDAFDARHGLQPLPQLVSVTEAAAALGVSRQAVLQRLESGSLPGEKVGKTWVVPRAALG